MACTELRLSAVFAVISALLVFDSSATITKFPMNTLVMHDENATLECSTDSTPPQGDNKIEWKYDHDILTYSPCQSQHPAFLTTSPDPDSDCNIIALADGVGGISGPYECNDESIPKAVAMVIVLTSQPICGPVVRRSSVDENESVDFTCSMTYMWHSRFQKSNVVPLITVSFGWMNDAITPSTKQLSSSSTGSEEANMTVVGAKKPEIPAQKCIINFTFARQPHYRQHSFAVNPVSYTCITKPIPVRHCPISVAVAPSSGPFKAGDVLTCTSDGYPEPSYTWTDGDGVVLSTTATITLTNSSFILNCTATGNLVNACSASAVISSADGMTTVAMTTESSTMPGSTLEPISVYYATPRRHIITGGTTVYIHGTGFNRLSEARLKMAMIYTRFNSSGNIITDETSFTSDPCVIDNSSPLTCKIPILDLPEEFRNLSDPSLTFPYNNLALHSSPLTAYNDRNSTLRFTESVLADGVICRWWNESFHFRFISLLPTISDSGRRPFSSAINIEGNDLDRGVTRAADYTVTLGEGRCTPNGELRSTMFKCEPPRSAPSAASDDNTRCNDSYALMVKLGGRLLGSAGCLSYSDVSPVSSTESGNGSLVYIIVIVGTIGIAIILLLMAVVIRAYLRWKRRVDEERRPLDQPKDSHGTPNGHAGNGRVYHDTSSELEMSEYGNASEFIQTKPRHMTSEVGCY